MKGEAKSETSLGLTFDVNVSLHSTTIHQHAFSSSLHPGGGDVPHGLCKQSLVSRYRVMSLIPELNGKISNVSRIAVPTNA